MKPRPPALAGLFYPREAHVLRETVERHLAEGARTLAAETSEPNASVAKAVIAPHAGMQYSGPIAGAAYARLAEASAGVERVVLMGPAHRVFVQGVCAPTVDAFETPLGALRVDQKAIAEIRDLPLVSLGDAPHAQEHSLEVHLPFIQVALGPHIQLVPLLVGDAPVEGVAELLRRLWGGPDTRIVISSDLSHFHDYSTAQRHDHATTRAIEALDGDSLDRDSACGRVPVRGLLRVAAQRGLRVSTLDLRNSGDTAGSKDRVVGYGAYALSA